MDGKEREQLERVLGRARKLEEQALEVAEGLAAMLNGDPTPGQQAKRLLGIFCQLWADKHKGHDQYVPVGARDMSMLKRLVASLGAEHVEGRMRRYFGSPDPFYRTNRYPLTLFVKDINRFGAVEADDAVLTSAPVDCQHRPPCPTDAQHTRRALAEARRVSS